MLSSFLSNDYVIFGKVMISLPMKIYIYMGSSFTWCKSIRVTLFLIHRFMGDSTDKNKTSLSIITLNTYLINSLLIISLFIKYFLCLFFSLLIKSFFPFSLQFLLRFNFLSFFFFSLNITFLIPILQNVQKKKNPNCGQLNSSIQNKSNK